MLYGLKVKDYVSLNSTCLSEGNIRGIDFKAWANLVMVYFFIYPLDTNRTGFSSSKGARLISLFKGTSIMSIAKS